MLPKVPWSKTTTAGPELMRRMFGSALPARRVKQPEPKTENERPTPTRVQYGSIIPEGAYKILTPGILTAYIIFHGELKIRPIKYRIGDLWFDKIHGRWYCFSLHGAEIIRYGYMMARHIRLVRYRIDEDMHTHIGDYGHTLSLMFRNRGRSMSHFLSILTGVKQDVPVFEGHTIQYVQEQLKDAMGACTIAQYATYGKLIEILQYLQDTEYRIIQPTPTFTEIISDDTPRNRPDLHGAMIQRDIALEGAFDILDGGKLRKGNTNMQIILIVIIIAGAGMMLYYMGGFDTLMGVVNSIPGVDISNTISLGPSRTGGTSAAVASNACDATVMSTYPTPVDLMKAYVNGHISCDIKNIPNVGVYMQTISDEDVAAALKDGSVPPNQIADRIQQWRAYIGPYSGGS